MCIRDRETYRLMFPGKEVSALIFTSTRRDTAPKLNEYIRDCSNKTGFPALYYSCLLYTSRCV